MNTNWLIWSIGTMLTLSLRLTLEDPPEGVSCWKVLRRLAMIVLTTQILWPAILGHLIGRTLRMFRKP